MSDAQTDVLQLLAESERVPLLHNPRKNEKIPQTPGIYALWLDEKELIYVGMVRTTADRERNIQSAGLAGRLHTYHRAPLTEKAILQIALIHIIPNLLQSDANRLLAGRLPHSELASMCREFVRSRVSCTTVSTTPEVAVGAEKVARRNGLPPRCKPPTLNPDDGATWSSLDRSLASTRQGNSFESTEDSADWEKYRQRFSAERQPTFEAIVDAWCTSDASQQFPSWTAFSRCVVAEPERVRNASHLVELAQATMEHAGYVKAGSGTRPELVWVPRVPA